MKQVLSCLAAVLLATLMTGCGPVEYAAKLGPCSPKYTAPSDYGRFTARQAGKGKAIQWGAYPKAKYSGTHYLVKVYAGGVKVDGKNQSYAPHGSLPATKARKYSGKKFVLTGTVHRKGKLVLSFTLQCKIA